MHRNVLIVGTDVLLGSELAALRLASSADEIFYAAEAAGPADEDFSSLVEEAARRAAPSADARSLLSRLHRLAVGPDAAVMWSADGLAPGVRFDAVWCLLRSAARGARASSIMRGLLSALPGIGATEFNYVGAACAAEGDGGRLAERPCGLTHADGDLTAEPPCALEAEVVASCRAWGVGYRIFRTSWVVGEYAPLDDSDRQGFMQFLRALHAVKCEVEERQPEYFEYQALRCRAPDGASVNLIRADRAAELLLRIAGRNDTSGGYYHVVAPASIPFAGLCERAGMTYDLSLLAVADERELNAVDRLFQVRAGGAITALATARELACDNTYRVAGLAPDAARLDEAAQSDLLRAVRRRQDADRAARMEAVAALPAALERKRVGREGDGDLTYYVGGAGETPVVLLNALGQGLHYWYRLIDRLMRRHRVIIWEPRGLEHSGRPFQLADQVDDLEAVLEREGVSACYLVGWCTGPKVAVDFYLRHQDAVPAMVFLNGSFKCVGGPAELDTAYERNFEPLCRALERRPAMAPSVMSSLRASVDDDGRSVWEDADPEQLSAGVLSTMNSELRRHVLSPFRSEGVLLNYCRQLLDFWSRDTLADAWRVRAPVLFVAAEYDKVASPDMSRDAGRRFPDARVVEVQGATHYCLYDRPDLISELIDDFFRDPHGPWKNSGEVTVSRLDRESPAEAEVLGSAAG